MDADLQHPPEIRARPFADGLRTGAGPGDRQPGYATGGSTGGLATLPQAGCPRRLDPRGFKGAVPEQLLGRFSPR